VIDTITIQSALQALSVWDLVGRTSPPSNYSLD